MSYDELVNRNWGFLSHEDQQRIKSSRILLAGCGLGSNVAILAARTGFSRFILADGDRVEINNLNRQAFRLQQVGANKAESVARLITEINPEAETEVFASFISNKEAPEMVTRSDIVINMIDPAPALFTLNRTARIQNKLVLFPLNVGFGGVTLAFSRDSATLEDMVGGEITEPVLFIKVIEKLIPYLPQLNDYMEKFAETRSDIMSGLKPGPQLGIAAHINAAIIVTAMIKWILGKPLRFAPEPLSFDAWFSIK